MIYAVIFFGLLSICCTCMLCLVIGVYNKKISEIHSVIAKLHVQGMSLESDVNVMKKKGSLGVRSPQPETRQKREVIYKIPKRISGDLKMEHKGKSALVKAVLKVREAE